MASTAPPLLPPGSRLAGYEIVGIVGRGGMGEVYRAKQLSMEREVALKILSPKLSKDPAFSEQFVAEARAAGKLNHPNIVGVHDVGQAPAPAGCNGLEAGEAVHYFSMEFIEGETVKDVIERQGAVDLATVGKVMAAMAEALSFAEAHKIVHRDIKPDNIMLTSAGLVKLADLGLALQADSAEAVAGSKDDQGRGKVMGTPLYMAPEQAKAQPIDHRADQYALGATLFHMLTGRPPYSGESSKAIMRAHCFEPVPDPAEANPEVPTPWREICRRMMAKLPDERFTGANELRGAIKAAIRWKPGTVYRPRAAESKPPYVLLTVLALALGGGLWWFLRVPTGGVTPGQDPPAEPVHPVPPTTVPSRDEAARALAAKALAALPADPEQAVRELDRLIADPALTPARDQLTARREQLRGAAEERRRAPLRLALDQAERDIDAGKFDDARDAIARTNDEAWLRDRRTAVARKLEDAEGRSERSFAERIAAAGDGAALDAVAAALSGSGLPEPRRAILGKQISDRRAALAPKQPKQQADPRTAWRQFGEQAEALRGALPYATFAELCRTQARNLADADKAQIETLASISDLAQQVETALRLYISQATPKAECRFASRSGLFILTRLEKDWIGFKLIDVPAESRADRASAVLPWSQLLPAAMAAHGKPDPRAEAAFLWFWRQADARQAIAKLKNDPLAAAMAEFERRIRPLDVPGDQDRRPDGLLAVSYPFGVSKDRALLEAWKGDGATIADRGLRWATTTTVPRGSSAENDLPSLRWRATLHAPVTLEATVHPEADTEVLLLGLSDGQRTVRIALNHKLRKAFAIATRDDAPGTYQALGNKSPVEYPGLEGVRLRLAVDAAGKVTMNVSDKPVTVERELSFPADARLFAIIQGRPVEKSAGLTIANLVLTGKP